MLHPSTRPRTLIPPTSFAIHAVLIILVLLLSLLQPTAYAQTCDYDNDLCRFPAEGECDATEGISVCPADSDCLDCDPCQEYNFIGCEACVNAGCVFCPLDALCLSQRLTEEYWTPLLDQYSFAKQSTCQRPEDWITSTSVCASSSASHFFSDPLYGAQQWAYQMLNVEAVWEQGITGQGVMIRVNDPEGVDVSHPDLADRFDEAASCTDYWAFDDRASHGTAVAALALGSGNNGHCSVGIAPEATLSACIGPTAISDENAAAFFLDGLTSTHVSINSWGFDACFRLPDSDNVVGSDDDATRRRKLQPCPFVRDAADNPCETCSSLLDDGCEDIIVDYCSVYFEDEFAGCAEFLDLFITCGYNTLSATGANAITRGVQEGRDGKGIIYVFASGNEFDRFEDVNFEGWLNTRMTITVGAVGKDGLHASYSSTGAALFISGPGGDHDYLHNNIVAAPGGGCTDATVGTSFAAPSVAGAIALVLSANPDLGWRDVQGVLASTAQKVDAQNPSWVKNAAGLHHSNLYGFGVMDASAAVEAAKNWELFSPERQIVAQSGEIRLPIPDDASDPATTTVTVNTSSGNFVTESVVVYLQLDHASRGDLEITLRSPGGTTSLLHPPFRPENQHLLEEERWKLLTVVNYGENPNGQWTLTLTDKSPGSLADCVDLPNFIVHVGNENDGDGHGIVDCGSIGASRNCVDGIAVNRESISEFQDETGQTALDACCACGGGMATSNVNALLSWRLVVYGHGEVGDSEDPPGSSAFSGGGDNASSGMGDNDGSNSGGGKMLRTDVERQIMETLLLLFGMTLFLGHLAI